MSSSNTPKTEKENLIPRPPIVVVMGHIDHGKSKLLDYIRHTNVVEKEAGGITQHIGAYEAEIKCEDESHKHQIKKLTFLDTPGHEAFSQMRIRGAKIADVAILVIAADEGPKPQTMEAYEAIQQSKTPFVIALNKIDKPNADPEKIKAQLAEREIFVEGYGGTIPSANISAKTGEGIKQLLDLVLLLAELENPEADPKQNASGVVIESNLNPKTGISATLLIRNGTMEKGMYAAAGGALAPIRAIENFQGKPLDKAAFSSPVKISGFNNLPETGIEFKTFHNKQDAEKAARKFKKEKESRGKGSAVQIPKGAIVIPLIIKADVAGSLEALEKELKKLRADDVFFDILRKGVGNISEDDSKLASSGIQNAIIMGFNVKTDPAANEIIERSKISVFVSDIIYKISEWLENEIGSRREKIPREEILGNAKILKTFSKAKNKQVIGGRVLSGKIAQGKIFKLKRNDAEIGEGKITGLQKNKSIVQETAEGDEFGALIESKLELSQGDIIEIVKKIG